MTEAHTELISIITKQPAITYYDLIQASKYSPSTIYRVLSQLKKEGKVKTVPTKRKARGWVVEGL